MHLIAKHVSIISDHDYLMYYLLYTANVFVPMPNTSLRYLRDIDTDVYGIYGNMSILH